MRRLHRSARILISLPRHNARIPVESSRSKVFADAIRNSSDQLARRKPSENGSWGTIPALSDVNGNQMTGQPRLTDTGSEPNPHPQSKAVDGLDINVPGAIFDHGLSRGLDNPQDSEVVQDRSSLGTFKPGYATRVDSIGLSPPESRGPQDLLSRGFSPGTRLGSIGNQSTNAAQSAVSLPKTHPTEALPNTIEPSVWSVGGTLADLLPSASPQDKSLSSLEPEPNANFDRLDGSKVNGFGLFYASVPPIETSSEQLYGLQQLATSGGQRSAPIDPNVAGLAFPGHDAFQGGPLSLGSVKADDRYAGVAGIESGKYGSESNAEGRSGSVDLSKTNDLLQQLLDAVSKGSTTVFTDKWQS